MKTTLHRLVLAIVLVVTLSNCTTAYDAYGRPQQMVDPGAAVAGAAAVGLLAYGLSQSNNHHYRDNYYSREHYRPSYSHYSGYRRGGYCGY